MKAIVYTQYGSPDVLQLMDIPKPDPKDNQVLVKVCAASANALDYRRFEELSTKVSAVIERYYPLSEVAESIRYLAEGHAKGKIVITVGNHSN
jgi:NADPH:quinone reductase-like Zn-dependent oxidoreductase